MFPPRNNSAFKGSNTQRKLLYRTESVMSLYVEGPHQGAEQTSSDLSVQQRRERVNRRDPPRLKDGWRWHTVVIETIYLKASVIYKSIRRES